MTTAQSLQLFFHFFVWWKRQRSSCGPVVRVGQSSQCPVEGAFVSKTHIPDQRLWLFSVRIENVTSNLSNLFNLFFLYKKVSSLNSSNLTCQGLTAHLKSWRKLSSRIVNWTTAKNEKASPRCETEPDTFQNQMADRVTKTRKCQTKNTKEKIQNHVVVHVSVAFSHLLVSRDHFDSWN